MTNLDTVYHELVAITDRLSKLAFDLDAAGNGDAADAVDNIGIAADILAGELSLLIHPTYDIDTGE